MPVPKKRLGHSDQGHRRSRWKATVPTKTICTNCGSVRHAHTICGTCGFYRDSFFTGKFLKSESAS
jgi:large subunit ribosomal protein L32